MNCSCVGLNDGFETPPPARSIGVDSPCPATLKITGPESTTMVALPVSLMLLTSEIPARKWTTALPLSAMFPIETIEFADGGVIVEPPALAAQYGASAGPPPVLNVMLLVGGGVGGVGVGKLMGCGNVTRPSSTVPHPATVAAVTL